MALILNLPVLKENPVMRAEIRPQKISSYIENLQSQSIQAGSSSLLRQLVELNRQKVTPKARIEINRLISTSRYSVNRHFGRKLHEHCFTTFWTS